MRIDNPCGVEIDRDKTSPGRARADSDNACEELRQAYLAGQVDVILFDKRESGQKSATSQRVLVYIPVYAPRFGMGDI